MTDGEAINACIEGMREAEYFEPWMEERVRLLAQTPGFDWKKTIMAFHQELHARMELLGLEKSDRNAKGEITVQQGNNSELAR